MSNSPVKINSEWVKEMLFPKEQVSSEEKKSHYFQMWLHFQSFRKELVTSWEWELGAFGVCSFPLLGVEKMSD